MQIGVIVGLVSTSVQSVGLTLQRKSHLLEEEKDDDYERRPPYKRRRWQVSKHWDNAADMTADPRRLDSPCSSSPTSSEAPSR